ncbi:helix-turn-helix domain-containing protein [Paenibacillus naphthalenovorans]|uniref:helix-turn-helix domain-containing protein n=1 Tax=Paenibacillus naphthalenovorans TaxID=162209 RepID=UPI003D2A4A27
MKRIPILGPTIEHGDDNDDIRNYYYYWRNNNSSLKSPFFSLFKSFKEKELLKDLDEGALRLYLYFGFVADNDHGHSWHSIETISKYFGKQTRTIDHWIKKLVDAGLIYRTKDKKKSHTTFLIPYTDTIIVQKPVKKHLEDAQPLLDDVLEKLKNLEGLYGKIIRVHHIFSWGTSKKTKRVSESADITNFLFIITQRPNDILVGHVLHLRKSLDKGISPLHIDDVAVFDSPYEFNGTSIQGIAVTHTQRIMQKENISTLMTFMRDLSQADEDSFLQHAKVIYGEISPVLETEDQQTEPEENEDEGGG